MLKYLATAMLLAAAMPATATTLVADTGWQDDTLYDVDAATGKSPWTFMVTEDSILSLVDCCTPGDVFTLSGDLVGITTFFAGNPTDIQADGSFYGGFWTDAAFSKIALAVEAGTYTFTIVGDGVGGLPASVGVRLDTVSVVPEPATWGLMISGFGLAGGMMRRRAGQVHRTPCDVERRG